MLTTIDQGEQRVLLRMLSPARILEFITDCQTQGILASVKNLRTWMQNQP
jgi:hypothetical protein